MVAVLGKWSGPGRAGMSNSGMSVEPLAPGEQRPTCKYIIFACCNPTIRATSGPVKAVLGCSGRERLVISGKVKASREIDARR